MENQLKVFSNSNFGEVRTKLSETNEPLFCLTDVCQALDLRQGDVRQRLEDGVVSTQPIYDSLGRQQFANFVNEDGLYDVILDSRKPEAKAFRKWITSEVLPSIRKDGGYMVTTENDTPEIILARAVIIAQKTIERLNEEKLIAERIIEEQKPKVEFYNDVTSSKDTMDMAQVAKTLNLGLGRNDLFKLLRERGILRQNNEPFQQFIDSQWFRCVETKYSKANGDIAINIKTVVFQKGLDKIRQLIINNK